MPLHLLGKKSWNVYNPENIARVRQDEATAKAQEERDLREQRSNDAEHRLQTLRGLEPPEKPLNASQRNVTRLSRPQGKDTARKRRKLAGEDDTDRDIRLARADAEAPLSRPHDATVFDPKCDIGLASEPRSRPKKEQEEQPHAELGGMRFKDAAGYKANGEPWYASKAASPTSKFQAAKDVWGNEDPRRRDREQQRMSASDPLLMIRRGVKQLRENERQRREWIDQREKDLYEVEKLARENGRKRRRRTSDEDSLEDFSLDTPARSRTHPHLKSEGGKEKPSRRGHKHRSRSPERRQNHRHRHRHRSGDS